MPRLPISQNKLAHTEAVSATMYESAIRLGWDERRAQEASLLGFLHDFGYTMRREGHGEAAADVLRRVGYRDAEAVACHGRSVENPSEMLMLLWHADMTCDHEGRRCTYDERLDGIRERYGADSPQLRTATEIVTKLREEASCTPI